MNKYIIYFLFISLLGMNIRVLYGQTVPCPSNQTSTQPVVDPNANHTVNQFDWTKEKFYINSTNYPGTSPFIGSPFYQPNTQLNYLLDGANSDFKWEDGWELIVRDFGYLMGGDPQNPDPTGSPNTSYNLISPYLVLYNKFEAKLRVFGAIGVNQLGYNSVAVRLRFEDQNETSAILSNHNALAQVLSEKTDAVEVKGLAQYPADKLLFFHADFPIAYDPCVCEFESELEVSFALIDEMDVNLYGRYTGLTTEIGSGGGAAGGANSGPTQTHNDFLSSLQSGQVNSSNVVAGAVTYKRIGDLEAKLKAIANKSTTDPNKQLKTILGILKLSSSLAAIYLPKLDVLKDNEYFTKKTGGFASDMKAVGLVTSFLSTQVKPSPSKSKPKPTVIEGETVFSGTITDTDTYGAGPIFANPGSDFDVNTLDAFKYPLYNEPLGLFAVLNKPEYKHVEFPGPTYSPLECQEYIFSANNRKAQRKFSNLEYVLNPSAEINEANTAIYGTLEFHTENNDLYETKNLFKLKKGLYVTPTLPIECLSEVVTEYLIEPENGPGCCSSSCVDYNDPVTAINLKIMVVYEFNRTNSLGYPHRSVQIFTYPMAKSTTNGTAVSNLEGIPMELEIPATHFTSNTDFSAWEAIKITGDLQIDPGVNVTIKAGTSIEVDPDIDLDPGIELIIESIVNCGAPLSQTNMGSFCTDGRYKANQTTKRANPDGLTELPLNNPKSANNLSLKARPNPFSDFVVLEYELPANEIIDLRLFDSMGREIRKLISEEEKMEGYHKFQLDGGDLAPGVYFAILKTKNGSKTVKIVKSNQ